MDKNIQSDDKINWNSSSKNKEMRCAVREMIMEQGADHFVTAVFNRETTFAGARESLKKWHALVDGCLLGSRWQKKPAHERTFFMAFAEHPDSNLHYHLMLRLADPIRHVEFAAIASECCA